MCIGTWLLLPHTTAIRGDDWVLWQDATQGIVAERVHPLLSRNAAIADKVQSADLLTGIDYQPVYQAEDVQRISHSAAPKTVFIYSIARPQAMLASVQSLNMFAVNGYRLPFSYTRLPAYFRAEPWLNGGLLFLSAIILLILLPILRSNLRAYGTLLGVLLLAMGLFGIAIAQHFYELLERDGASLSALRSFAGARTMLLLMYAGMSWMNSQTRRSYIAAAAGTLAVAYLLAAQIADWQTDVAEHGALLAWLLLVVPMAEASVTRLQFGRVSLIITRTIQYLVVFALGMGGLLAMWELSEGWLANAAYRMPIVAAAFVGAAVLARLLYAANADRLRRYFTTPQHAREERFLQFVARIPQYTAAKVLFADIASEIQVFCGATAVQIIPCAADAAELDSEAIHAALAQKNAIWAVNKELSAFAFPQNIEKDLVAAGISLIFPITANDTQKYILLLDKKKRSVYNLSETEAIAQLVRQTQLTLSVLQLVGKQQELLRQTYEANLTALRSQINPHFLFNTLNTISALIHDAPEQAETATERLAYIFRYTLRNSDKDFVPLEDELSLVRAYLSIEKARFGERLAFDIDFAPEVRAVQMPAFVVQTFVENCIKHGIAKIVEKGVVSIFCEKEDSEAAPYLRCVVTDNGVGIDLGRVFASTGLKNVVSRIETLYGRRDLLTFENLAAEGSRGTRVVLRIPMN